MRHSRWLAIVLSLAAQALFSQSLTSDLAAIQSFFPRREGSDGEKRTISYIELRLATLGVKVTPFDFRDSDFEHSFSSCLRVDLPGQKKDTLVLAVPLDQPPDSEKGRDGAISIALALNLISQWRSVPPPVSLTVLFLGAEFGDTDAYPMGSTLFLRDFQPEYRVALMYLNLRDVPSRILLRGGGRGIVTPYWLMNRTVAALQTVGLPYVLRGEESQIFRISFASGKTLIEPYLKAGYPSIELDGEYAAGDPGQARQWMESFPTFFTSLLQETAEGIPEDWDRHYLLFQVGDHSLIITERAYLVVLIIVLAGILSYSLSFREGLRRYTRTLLRNLPALLPIAGVAFLFLLAGTLAVEGIQALRSFSAFWSYAPAGFLILKACVALFLYGILYNPARRLPFPRNGSFYSAAALYILVLDVVIVALFNISFTWYFLWAFLFVFLSALARPRWAKVLLFLPAPYWGIRGLIEVFAMPVLPLCHFLLLSPIWGNMFLAAACLPFILVILRLGLILPGRGILRRRIREYALAAALLAGVLIVGTRLMLFSPFSPANPQPIAALQALEIGSEDEVTRDTLSVSSPAPLGALTVSDSAGSRELVTRGTSVTLQLPVLPTSPVKISQDSSSFFGQRTVTLGISMPASPRAMFASLSSTDDFILYDCSFPFLREGPNRYRILIGAFAPNPLSLQLTLPAGGTFTLGLGMEFDLPLIDAQLGSPGSTRTSTRVKVQKNVEVKT